MANEKKVLKLKMIGFNLSPNSVNDKEEIETVLFEGQFVINSSDASAVLGSLSDKKNIYLVIK